MKLITTPTVCRPDPRTTPLQTPLNEDEKKKIKKRNILLKKYYTRLNQRKTGPFWPCHAFQIFHSNKKRSLVVRLIMPNLVKCRQHFSASLRFFVITGMFEFNFSMSLQQILMKLLVITQFSMINWSKEVAFCLHSHIKKNKTCWYCTTTSKTSIFLQCRWSAFSHPPFTRENHCQGLYIFAEIKKIPEFHQRKRRLTSTKYSFYTETEHRCKTNKESISVGAILFFNRLWDELSSLIVCFELPCNVK